MRALKWFLAFCMIEAAVAQSAAAAVSEARADCIRGAMAAGSAALGNPVQLNRLFERYFAGEQIAQLAAGRNWRRMSDTQRDVQRSRVRQFVVNTLAPNLSHYRGSRVRFVSESGSKVTGVVTAPTGERRRITWHFAGRCKFVNVSIEGLGSLVSFVGRGPGGKRN